MAPPEGFEPGRMNAVGIFLGRRGGEGFAVNILSTTRRRDRIFVVFEERMPADIVLAGNKQSCLSKISASGCRSSPSMRKSTSLRYKHRQLPGLSAGRFYDALLASCALKAGAEVIYT